MVSQINGANFLQTLKLASLFPAPLPPHPEFSDSTPCPMQNPAAGPVPLGSLLSRMARGSQGPVSPEGHPGVHRIGLSSKRDFQEAQPTRVLIKCLVGKLIPSDEKLGWRSSNHVA